MILAPVAIQNIDNTYAINSTTGEKETLYELIDCKKEEHDLRKRVKMCNAANTTFRFKVLEGDAMMNNSHPIGNCAYNHSGDTFEKVTTQNRRACVPLADGWEKQKSAAQRMYGHRWFQYVAAVEPGKMSPPECAFRVVYQMHVCNTCCCRGGQTTTSAEVAMIHGTKKECGATMLFMDMAFRTILMFGRFGTMLDRVGRRCMWHADKENFNTDKRSLSSQKNFIMGQPKCTFSNGTTGAIKCDIVDGAWGRGTVGGSP